MIVQTAAVTPESVELRVVLSKMGEACVHVNGSRVPTGVCVLEHGDELRVGAHRAWFSTERLASVIPFGDGAEPACPRCRTPVHQGDPSVRCPQCQIVHHQAPNRACWTYLERCSACDQPTALDAGLRWSPGVR